MAVERSDYEESRKARVEENKRRMQELGIMELSKDLKGSKQKNVARKPLKRKIDDAGAESRRSSRVAAKPAVSYKDQFDLLPGMRARCGTRERVGLGRRYVSDVSRRAAYEAAEEAFEDIRNPGFVKAMLHSHVSSCFWLGLPNRFCQEHMPLEEATFILEDDKGEKWECLYLAHKTGMSGGWRGFSLDHELVDGDSCIFELVSPLRFKVHFFRCEEQEGGPEDVDEKKTGVKVAGKDIKAEKKAGKVATKKKAGSSKGRKSSKSSSKKLKVEDGEEDEEDDEESAEDDEGDDYAPRVSKQGDDTNVAGPSRASRRKVVKKEEDSGESYAVARKNIKHMELGKQKGTKEPDYMIELESGEDEDEDKGARKSAAMTKTNQGGSVLSGRATRNSLRRSLPPSLLT